MSLSIVATPIGNLGDMTYRAVQTLQTVDLIVCEDTRQTRKLCQHYQIDTPLSSFHARSTDRDAQRIIDQILQGKNIAYVSDAGTPCISDPGYKLTSLAAQKGIPITPLPGPSAITTLISASGFPTNTFTFHGFIPHKKGRQTLIKSLNDISHPHAFYESVHRFPKLLRELAEYLDDDRQICVGRELTKLHEEIWRGTVSKAIEHFDDSNTRGEFVVIVSICK